MCVTVPVQQQEQQQGWQAAVAAAAVVNVLARLCDAVLTQAAAYGFYKQPSLIRL
jgi:hypothetical protein